MTDASQGTDKVDLCSAWEAFDRMQLCYAILPQVRHFYRYGSRKDCSAAREEFSFCMSLKPLSQAEAEKRMAEREAMKQRKMTTERPSKSIWKIREDAAPS
ncbi:hypothetical protein DFJ74DRAFT_660776 [Hyaloraphidium curvatum]|nr:hypothetical protein DFJ74DRAFT_660776 [Hyaloraphidium curvatum]